MWAGDSREATGARGVAFWLFVLNQLVTSIPSLADDTAGYEYLLRVLGFLVIIAGIIDKNRGPSSRTPTS